MMNARALRMIGLGVFVCFMLAGTAFAEGGCQCKDQHHKRGMKDKFLHMVRFAYLYQDEIGVSDEQMDKIKAMKLQFKKDHIQREADIGLVAADIKAGLWEDVIDTKALNELVDKKYDLKKEKAKSLIKALADLKQLLTAEQKDKLKNLMREKKKEGKRFSHH